MTIRNIAEVRARLETAVAGLPGIPADAEKAYERYEQIAIAMLDSEFEDFTPGLLEEYLEISHAQPGTEIHVSIQGICSEIRRSVDAADLADWRRSASMSMQIHGLVLAIFAALILLFLRKRTD